MRPRLFAPGLAAAALVLAAAGCGGEAPARVTGSVTIDGRPLPEGEIVFEAADGKKTPAAAPIRNGKYEILVLPGPKKVLITASRPTAKPDPVMGAAAREHAVSLDYSERSKLTADVKPGGQDGVDFQVKAAP